MTEDELLSLMAGLTPVMKEFIETRVASIVSANEQARAAAAAAAATPTTSPPLRAVEELEMRVRELREDVLAKAAEQREQHVAALQGVQVLVEQAGARAEAAEAAALEAKTERDALAASAPIEGAEALADMLVARFDEATECV